MDNLKIFNELSRLCSKKVTQLYSTSFSSAISVLHSDLHRPVYSIYGFVRLADEIVDSFHGYDKKSLLDDFKRDTFGAIASGVSINPVLHSFQWVVNTYDIDHHYIHAFFESMYADLDKKVWKDQNELNAYIYGSAEVVGLMCLHIFCEGDQELIKKLTPSAQALGAAFQKVNFMRDLREDTYDLGRRYFHDIQMDQFDKDTKIKIEEQITKDFEEAFNGLMQLPSKSRYGVLLAYRYYLCLFEKIKRLPPESILNKRIRVPDYQKLFLLLRISVGSRLATNLA